MRNLCLALLGVVLALSISGAALGQMHEVKIQKGIECGGMMGGGMSGQSMMECCAMGTGMMGSAMPCPGMMCCGMMGHGMLQATPCCPAMIGRLRDVGDYLSYKDLIELSDEQVSSLKSIGDAHQRELIRMRADLQLAMLDLGNLLGESDVDLSKAESLTDKIAGIQAQMRFKRIEVSVKAKRVLSKQQLEKLEESDSGTIGEKPYHRMMQR